MSVCKFDVNKSKIGIDTRNKFSSINKDAQLISSETSNILFIFFVLLDKVKKIRIFLHADQIAEEDKINLKSIDSIGKLITISGYSRR
tara:strand:- start:267 stop:530 length:264 start_codon:yes stop_codon:yes gene_type:complete